MTPMEAACAAVCRIRHENDEDDGLTCGPPGNCANCLELAEGVIRAYNGAMLTKEPICIMVSEGREACEGGPARPTAET